MKNLVDGGMKDGAIAGLENGGWMVAASGSSVIIKLSKLFRYIICNIIWGHQNFLKKFLPRPRQIYVVKSVSQFSVFHPSRVMIAHR